MKSATPEREECVVHLAGTREQPFTVLIKGTLAQDGNETIQARVAVVSLGPELAERATGGQQLFVHAVSHDLQSPLNTIAGYAGLLNKRYSGQLGEEVDEFLEKIVSGTRRMQKMIQGFMELATLQTQDIAFSEVDMETVLEDVLANLEANIQLEGATITSDPLPTVQGDPSLLLQVLQNFVENGIKFHREGVAPAIQIGVSPGKNDTVSDSIEWDFFVQDNGIGIEPSEISWLFAPFHRLNPERQATGTGIGLAISKQIVDGHGGRVYIESIPGVGSTFHFTIPRNLTQDLS
jgi:light-regulated signal transduction histidine kinase (bacteriophytochrome)